MKDRFVIGITRGKQTADCVAIRCRVTLVTSDRASKMCIEEREAVTIDELSFNHRIQEMGRRFYM